MELRQVAAKTAGALVVIADSSVAPSDSDKTAIRIVLALRAMGVLGHSVRCRNLCQRAL